MKWEYKHGTLEPLYMESARSHFEIFDKNLILHSKFQKKSMLMTQYRLLSYRKWLSIGYWARYLNIWNFVANNSEQGIFVSSANIYHHRTGGNVPWWPGCTPAEFLPMTQYSILSHYKLLSIEYWVIKDTESLYCSISTLCTAIQFD